MADDIRVLIVDDDFHVAKLHVAYVNAIPGFTALPPVSGGEEAIRVVRAMQPELVLLDIYLPDVNGLDVLRGLDVDVFVISAASDVASVQKALRRGALSYLIKPFRAEFLEQRLRAYARYRSVLAAGHTLDQEAVERALRILHPGESGAGKPRAATEAAVLEILRRTSVPTAASEVASEVGISRATAQRYLSSLVYEGAATVQLRYGSTGRPEHRYSVRGAGPADS
ncbi:response regulator [Lacisediminihabitans sp.]|jgi:two-component system CitB family response regulator|uniref:response regulator n=1 Tax=Lacisediminihabitans sp. TaxID=2787631 RepID=UPI002F93D15B